ncbi:hypothetical protein DUI87_07457 [Hirundo rustica rustica]|uniref:Uncharacterized protein n=1 Tax=Hirundo rustica rustica TaxID=333673 RepID=A0A3M0KPT6_HIRRU|nr:hypothetical protein DUI87_07457 [Hirundo rustica rustica]
MLRIRLLRLLARNVILQEQLPENFHQISTNQFIASILFLQNSGEARAYRPPVKEEVAGKHQPKFSAQHNPSSTENGELHGHYHGYYVKMNPTVLPQELREEDEYSNPSPSTLARIPPSQKPSPARSGGKPDAKENKPDIKIKKPEFAAPKNPANNESHSTLEKEVGNSSAKLTSVKSSSGYSPLAKSLYSWSEEEFQSGMSKGVLKLPFQISVNLNFIII